MGWLDRANDIIGKLRASGRSEAEVEEIVESAADKATAVRVELTPQPVRKQRQQPEIAEAFGLQESVLNTTEHDRAMQIYMENMRIAAEAAASLRMMARREPNNYRRMHGQPMRRRQAMRRNDRNGNRERAVTHR